MAVFSLSGPFPILSIRTKRIQKIYRCNTVMTLYTIITIGIFLQTFPIIMLKLCFVFVTNPWRHIDTIFHEVNFQDVRLYYSVL